MIKQIDNLRVTLVETMRCNEQGEFYTFWEVITDGEWGEVMSTEHESESEARRAFDAEVKACEREV